MIEIPGLPLIETFISDPHPDLGLLRRELGKIAAIIASTQREIAGIKPNISSRHHAGAAAEELAIAVSSTEEAATNILAIAERFLSIEMELKAAGVKGSLCDEIGTHAVNLMVACSFQDITGQRMTKAAKTLQHIDERIDRLIAIWGDGSPAAESHAGQESCDSHLMNGPSLAGEGIDQDDIDALMA